MDQGINKYVKTKKKEFLNVANKNTSKEIKYDFILQADNNKLNNNLDIHLIALSYTGGNHYIRDDYSIHYDIDNNKYMNLSDYFINQESFKRIDDLVYYELKNNEKFKQDNLSEILIRRGISPNNSNYKHFLFKNNGLEISFPPEQISSWSSGEIKVLIPYEELNDLLKEKYRGKVENSKKETIIPKIRSLSQFKDKKLVAFTFDDGPNTKTTNLLLDNLDKYNAKVTFFVLGSRVDMHKEVLKRAYLEGNQIGSHTYNHKNLNLLDNDEIRKEIDNTNELIKEVIGVYPSILRPPYGNINKKVQKEVKMPSILWSVDTLDWKYRDREKVKKTILENVHDGDIILLHDLYKTSIEGALDAMEELYKEGYRFVTIQELAFLKDIELNNNIYNKFINN